jgi:hypothetical protein
MPASMQFGLRAVLHAHYFGFGFDGELGLDALIGFDGSCAIHFDAELTFSVLGRTLAGFDIEATYTATDRYRLKGKAHYEFLWFDGTKHFDVDLGTRDAPRLPVSELEQALAAELPRHEAWRPPVAAGVVLVERERAITIGPDGRTYFEQSLVPLNVTIDLFGMQRLAEPKAMRIEVGPLGSTNLRLEARQGEFAPGLFFEMSEQEVMRAPVVVSHDAGFEVSLPLRGGAAREVDDDWDDVVVDPQYVPPPAAPGPRRGRLELPRLAAGSTEDAGVRPSRPVQVHPLLFRTHTGPPMTWMRARQPMPVRPKPPPGMLFALTSTPLEAAQLVEAWR